ncbi:MAG: DUF4230 domain-containing protein [Kaiparowitsia implicata GSE-PSE-MK54-09C]|jgi:hypothetical protein|nr:DUF4230 domain-containing protein [Kaiparowitsia implicata GSE-PSE-MK54-09C]
MNTLDSSTPTSTPNSQPVQNLIRNTSLLVTGGILATSLFVGVGLWRSGAAFLSELGSFFTLTEAEPTVDIQSLVVKQVREASELTTAVFTMQAIVPAQQDRLFAGYVVGSTRLLYIAQGEVRAGVDLSQLTRDDVQLLGDAEGTLVITLPSPQILDRKIDVDRSQIYDYDRGFLGLGPDVAPYLQQTAQRQTLDVVLAAACRQGILQQANDRAQAVVSQLLSTTGQLAVRVDTQPAAADACAADASASTVPSSLTEGAIAPQLAPQINSQPAAETNPEPATTAPYTPAVPPSPSGSSEDVSPLG